MIGPGARATLAAGLVAAAACAGGDDAGGGPYAREVAERVPIVEEALGLRFKQPPKVEARSREELRDFLVAQVTDSLALNELRLQERVYKVFGLLPDTMDTEQLLLDVLTEQVAGYYDPETETLYVVEGGQNDAIVTTTITHELIHALQDQHLNLDSLQDVRGDNDRTLAAQAVIEGQATFEQIRSMMRGNLGALSGGWEMMRQQIRENRDAMPQFSAAPMFIQETLIFPYLSGAEFMQRYSERRPGSVPFDSMPVSTEQILHPEKYEQWDGPTPVTLPAPRGADVVYDNNLGEFETRLLLFEPTRDIAAAQRGARGWDGDRYQLVRTPRGDGLVWASVWDSAVDAGEFLAQMNRALERRLGTAATAGSTSDRRSYRGKGRSVVLTTAEVDGRPVVLYSDVPEGANPDLVPVDRVRLGEQQGPRP